MIRWLALFIFISSSLHAQNILSLLPESSGKWQKKDQAEVFSRDSLYALIDGGAEIFIEYGFEAAAVQNYTDDEGNLIEAEIYEMKDSSAAYGIFSLNTLRTGRRIDFSCSASLGNEFLIFQKGRYYICLTSLLENPNTQKGLLEIAKTVEPAIPHAEKPGLVSKFTKLLNSKNVYIKGMLGFYNLTTFNPGDNFRIEEGLYFEAENVKSFILYYKTAEECRKYFSILSDNFKMSAEYKISNSGTDEVLVKDSSSFIKCSRIGSYLILSFAGNKRKLDASVKRLKYLLF